MKEKLFLTKPFDEFKDFVNISYITMDKTEERQYFKPAQGMPPLNVRIDLLNNISKNFGVYKLIILDYQNGSTCAKLSSIDKFSLVIVGRNRYAYKVDFSKGFLHELGHSLGLRDECINCEKVEPGYPNCAPNKELAKQWWGELAGKYPGVDYINGCCGNPGYIRPTIASLMNDIFKAANYGLVNEEYLRKELLRLKQKN